MDRTLRTAINRWIHQLTGSNRRSWLVIFILLSCVYVSTAHWYGIGNVDSVAASFPGWEFVHHGSFYIPADRRLPENPWFVLQGGHFVTIRTAGVILIGVPAQAAFLPFDVSPITPAVLTASLLTAAAMANLALVFCRLGGRPRVVLCCTLAVALGTGFWPNASAELWTHGPDAFWISLALLALGRERLWWAGAALAPAVMTRAHLALAAALLGVVIAAAQRRPWPLVQIGLPTGLGVGLLICWNWGFYGEPTVGGPAYTYAAAAATQVGASALQGFADSASGSLISPLRGLIVYSPFVVLAGAAAVRGLRRSAPWVRGCFAGGVAYQLAQWQINGFAGGSGYYSYRLPLELLVLSAPAAFLGYDSWRKSSRRVQLCARLLVGLSVATQVVGVYWYQTFAGPNRDPDPWTTWGLLDAARSRGATGTVAAALVFAVVTALCLLRLDRAEPVVNARDALGVSAAAPS